MEIEIETEEQRRWKQIEDDGDGDVGMWGCGHGDEIQKGVLAANNELHRPRAPSVVSS